MYRDKEKQLECNRKSNKRYRDRIGKDEWNNGSAKRMQKTRKNNPLQDRKNKLKSQYGITLDEYDLIFDEQGGLCAICGKAEESRNNQGVIGRLQVDHDHETGKVRGLLCQKCNRGLGFFDDNISKLINAAKYLEETVK